MRAEGKIQKGKFIDGSGFLSQNQKSFFATECTEDTERKKQKIKIDEFVKSRISIEFVIPAKAGIQLFQDVLDPGFRRGDDPGDFLRDHQN